MQCKLFFIAINLRYIKGWFCGFGISESNFVDLCRTAEAVTETREMISGYLTNHPVAATPRGCPADFREIGERQVGSIPVHFRQLFIARFVATMFFYPKTVSLFSLLFFILILAPPSFAEDGFPSLLAAKRSSLKPAEHSDPEVRLILLMNQTRTKAGLRSLKPSRLLGEVARAHSREMRDENFFSHTNPAGMGPKERLERAGFAWKAFGENIGCGQDSPEKILLTWMNSASHRETLLDPIYTEVGIGLVRGGECLTYWTALFARPRG